MAYVMYSLRIIYTNLIFAAGKFKETQNYCIIECILNLVISLALVKPLGLVGVALGTVISSGYRMVASAYYLKKDILKRGLGHLYKHLITDCICFCLVVAISRLLEIPTPNFFWLIIYAAVCFIISMAVCLLVHFITYKKQMTSLVIAVLRKIKR